MKSHVLRIMRNSLIGLATAGAVVAVIGTPHADAADDFVSGNIIDLTRRVIDIDDFLANTEVVNRLSSFAELDNVDLVTDCAQMTGMPLGLVGGFEISGTASADQKKAMLYNTWFLQQQIYCGSQHNGSAGTTIKLPEGNFYFVSGHQYMANYPSDYTGARQRERHVIKLHSYVTLIGKGTEAGAGNNVNNNVTNYAHQTVLLPYSEVSEFSRLNINGGMEMFFYNDYVAWNQDGRDPYITDIHFRDFIIDSKNTTGRTYTTAGKGFMINIFNNGTWDNITVRNTDATGFGMDCPTGNSYINNSRAINDGKAVNDVKNGGGSGFGIGTGYSNSENFVIRNSVAEGNGIFGFFYEHQGRFGANKYLATTGNFRIENSIARNNTYNYGGLRANDVTLANITSEAGSKTLRHIHFSDESRDIKIDNVKIGGSAFSDVRNNSTKWYADAVLWAEEHAVAAEAIDINNKRVKATDTDWQKQSAENLTYTGSFGIGGNASRADVVAMIWRMMGYPGETLSGGNNNLVVNSQGQFTRRPNTPTCFDDVESNRPYAIAVQWAYSQGITNGVQGCSAGSGGRFFATQGSEYSETVTRAEVVTMLYRLSGSPAVTPVEDFEDVTDKTTWYYNAVQWAVQNKLTNGTGDNHFSPHKTCTREQVVAFLYRYWAGFICPGSGESCPDRDVLLNIHHNE